MWSRTCHRAMPGLARPRGSRNSFLHVEPLESNLGNLSKFEEPAIIMVSAGPTDWLGRPIRIASPLRRQTALLLDRYAPNLTTFLALPWQHPGGCLFFSKRPSQSSKCPNDRLGRCRKRSHKPALFDS